MKKLLSNILAIAISVFAFLGFLMPLIVQNSTLIGNSSSSSISGYDFISFNEGVDGMVIAYSIAVIALFIVAGLLAVLSLARIFIDNGKKPKYQGIQNLLAIVLAILSVLVLVFTIINVSNGVSIDLGFIANTSPSIGIASILVCGVSVIGSLLVMFFKKK